MTEKSEIRYLVSENFRKIYKGTSISKNKKQIKVQNFPFWVSRDYYIS